MDERSLQELAKDYGIKTDRLRRAAWDGRLEARQVGNQWVAYATEVERFLRDGGRRKTVSSSSLAHEVGQPSNTRIIVVAVPKGGTAKTTTTMNLGAALAEKGQRVLLVDLDPQANLTQSLGYRPGDLDQTIYNAMKFFLASYESSLDKMILSTNAGVDLIPASVRLNLANDELSPNVFQREFVLQRLLNPIASRYDFILIDTLPYLGILVVNALVAAKEIIIPLQAEYLAIESVELMLDHIKLIRRSGLNPDLLIKGILLTMVDARTVMNREAVEHARKGLGANLRVFETVIKRSVRFPESQANHKTILQYEPGGEGARAYRALAEEILNGKA